LVRLAGKKSLEGYVCCSGARELQRGGDVGASSFRLCLKNVFSLSENEDSYRVILSKLIGRPASDFDLGIIETGDFVNEAFNLSEGWRPAARVAAGKIPSSGTRYAAKTWALRLSGADLLPGGVAGSGEQRSSILIVASHSENSIHTLCNKAMWLHRGNLVEYRETDYVLAAYKKFREDPHAPLRLVQ
jgi:hypothetical protein